MPAQWTGDIIGQMHLIGTTSSELSKQLGYNPKYVSAILNGKRSPKGAEEKFRKALQEIKMKKGESNEFVK